MKWTTIDVLVGQTLASVTQHGNELIEFVTNTGTKYHMYHEQDCRESVRINDIAGDLQDLVNTPIVKAYESNSEPGYGDKENPDPWGSGTWTFYHLATSKGYVTIRWYGESNGYYSESVSFSEVDY